MHSGADVKAAVTKHPIAMRPSLTPQSLKKGGKTTRYAKPCAAARNRKMYEIQEMSQPKPPSFTEVNENTGITWSA